MPFANDEAPLREFSLDPWLRYGEFPSFYQIAIKDAGENLAISAEQGMVMIAGRRSHSIGLPHDANLEAIALRLNRAGVVIRVPRLHDEVFS